MVTPTFPEINFSQIKSVSRRSSVGAHEKCGSTLSVIGPTISLLSKPLSFWQPIFVAHLLDDGIASYPSTSVAASFDFEPKYPLATTGSLALLASLWPTIGPNENDPR